MSKTVKKFIKVWNELAENGLLETFVHNEFLDVFSSYQTTLNEFKRTERAWMNVQTIPVWVSDSIGKLSQTLEELEFSMKNLIDMYTISEPYEISIKQEPKKTKKPKNKWVEILFEEVKTGDLIRFVTPAGLEGVPFKVAIKENANGVYFVEHQELSRPSKQEPFYINDLPANWVIERKI